MIKEQLYVILFYKYINIDNPEKFVKQHLNFCKKIGILGRVLVAKEGINGTVSGTRWKINKYISNLKKNKKFSDIEFKEDTCLEHPFTKMKVKLRKEIVTFGKKVNLKNKGKYIAGKELLDIYNTQENKFVILDVRNDYEYKSGRFKNAINLNIKNFREFPKQALGKLSDMKNEKIVMYCTGGIRCEKASAFLKENGFNEVFQLHDGIIKFGKEFPDTLWEGKCFVFDKRLVSSVNKNDKEKDKILEKCKICGKDSDLYRNCKNPNCDKLIICCLECQKRLNGCCSKECLTGFRKHCIEKSLRKQGRKTVTH